MGLLEEDMHRIQGQFKIPVTEGGGTGVGGVIVAACRLNPVLALHFESSPPTNEELQLLADYRAALVHWMYPRDEGILAMDFPAVEGHNTTLFVKGPCWPPNEEDGWAYRMMTWNIGPLFIPTSSTKTRAPHTLEQVLERIKPGWSKWAK